MTAAFILTSKHAESESRTVVDERVELAVLAAGVDARRQILEKSLVELAADQRRGQHLFVDRDDARTISRGDDSTRQLAGGRSP